MDFADIVSRCSEAISEKNLTIKDVSHLSNISEATIYRTLSSKGQNASVATLQALCDALGVSAFHDEGNPASSLEAVYLARIADLKQVIAAKDRWLKAMFIALAVLVGFILTILAVDLANPSVGWFRSALGLMASIRGLLL